METTMQQFKPRSYDLLTPSKGDGEWITKKPNRHYKEKIKEPSVIDNKPSRYDIFSIEKEKFDLKREQYNQKKEASKSSNILGGNSRYDALNTHTHTHTHKEVAQKKSYNGRDLKIFDTMKNKIDEEREEKREYYSHIKFRSNKTADSGFEVFNSEKYQKQADINNIEEFPLLCATTSTTESSSIDIQKAPPVTVKSVWGKKN